MPAVKRPAALSWRKKLVFSLVTTVAFFALLELGLMIAGVRPVTDTSDPFVGFAEQIPLLTEVQSDDGELLMQTAPNKLVW